MDDSTGTTPSPSTATATAAGYEAARDKQQTKNNNIGNSNVAASAAAGNNNSGSSVRLLIKSSNQQYDDMNIESDLCWTVERLKKQLSLVYPGKPVGAPTNTHISVSFAFIDVSLPDLVGRILSELLLNLQCVLSLSVSLYLPLRETRVQVLQLRLNCRSLSKYTSRNSSRYTT